jgi:hypothetical protein
MTIMTQTTTLKGQGVSSAISVLKYRVDTTVRLKVGLVRKAEEGQLLRDILDTMLYRFDTVGGSGSQDLQSVLNNGYIAKGAIILKSSIDTTKQIISGFSPGSVNFTISDASGHAFGYRASTTDTLFTTSTFSCSQIIEPAQPPLVSASSAGLGVGGTLSASGSQDWGILVMHATTPSAVGGLEQTAGFLSFASGDGGSNYAIDYFSADDSTAADEKNGVLKFYNSYQGNAANIISINYVGIFGNWARRRIYYHVRRYR